MSISDVKESKRYPLEKMNLPLTARYVHTNLIAHDWHALADFYQRVFSWITDPEGNIIELQAWA